MRTGNAQTRNPLRPLFWLTLLACVAGAGMLVFFLSNPTAFPRPLPRYVQEEAYAFDRLELNRPFFSLVVNKGYLVPVYAGGSTVGAVLVGPGSYLFAPPSPHREEMEKEIGLPVVEDRFRLAYVTGNYQEVENLRYAAGARPVQENPVLKEAQSFLQTTLQGLPGFPLATVGPLPLVPTSSYTLVSGVAYGDVAHTAGGDRISLTFLTLGRHAVSFAGTPSPPASGPVGFITGNLAVGILITIVNMGLLCFLIYVLTLDIEKTLPAGHLKRPSLPDLFLLLAVLLLEAAHGLAVAQAIPLALERTYLLYALLVILVAFFAYRQGYPAAGMGITSRHAFRSVWVGLLLGLLAVAAITLSPPRAFGLPAWAVAGRIAWSFLTAGLLKSFYQQGFLQTTLQRAMGPRAGLLCTAVLAGLVYLIPRSLAWPGAGLATLLQGGILIPGATLLAAYLFHRTGNLLAPATARGLLDALPQVLRF